MCAAAGSLARVWADPADRRRQRDFFLYYFNSAAVVTLCNSLNISLTVGTGRTVKRARSLAVALMVAHEQLQRNFTNLYDALRLGEIHGAVSGDSRAGAHQLGRTLHLNNTDSACAVAFYIIVMAKRRNDYAVCGGDIQNSVAAAAGTYLAVYSNSNFIHSLSPYLTFIAPKRQSVTH